MIMKKVFLFLVLTSALFLTSCATVQDLVLDKVRSEISERKNSPEAQAKIAEAEERAKESIKKAVEEITPEQEYYIGRTVASTILNKYKLSKDSKELTVYLNQICNAITINSEMPYLYKGYYVGILDTDEINAMATPGGHILITRGLINCTDSEDALAAVIAHEVGHIQLKHSITAIRSSRATDAIMATASVSITSATAGMGDKVEELTDGLNDAANDIAKNIVETGFSKAQEFAADKMAILLMNDAGYDPNCMLDMLGLLKLNSEGNTEGFSKTHPSPDSRIENVKKELKSMKIKVSASDKNIRTKRFNSINNL